MAKAAKMLNREALWTTVALDFFGPLPRTSRGNVYVLVGIDHFSRWPEAVATRVATAAVVAQFLHHRIIPQHGTPKELLTDHGTHFASHVIAELCKRYKVRRLMSTPYTPQSNGIVERFMGYMKNALVTLISQHPKAWDEHLPAVLFAYRATPHPNIGDTPFFINKGYDPWIPEMLAVDAPEGMRKRDGNWLEVLLSTRRTLEGQVAQQQARLQEAQKVKDEIYFATGQLVLVKRTPAELQSAHTKLTDKYDHPARIVAVMPNGVSYQLVFINSGCRSIVNRRQLRPFILATSDDDDDNVFPQAQPTSLPLAPVS